ncbi:hypothetical protein [Fimbriimonas ginsengisoli]|uniref:Uncharacterized protein n=1 Tax=Fimbriimonas ginsengisoli Gsoil 348 TaxID=661478 RepID=A0A068NTW9_FIMGI|nr:hypothetical protein [Fimbriimonas ginsengisoli]AIE86886.1 hypothetical protein OP10G_3518 [Fimbriimonas ginsengisoli Gsoil 348]
MALNTVLVLAAGFGFIGTAQDPSLDQQIVTPVIGTSQNTQGSQAATSSPKVTVQFRGVKASEVFSWLENRGVNFVVSDGEIPAGTNVTLNLQDVSLDGAVDAIARALGGHWEKENGIRVFKRGEAPFRFFSGPEVTAGARNGAKSPFQALPRNRQSFNAMPAMPAFPQGHPLSDKEAEKLFGKDYQKRMEEWGQEFAKKFGPEQEKAQKKWAEEFAKQHKGEFGPGFQFKMQKEFGPEFQQRMQKEFGPEFQQRMQKEFGPEFQQRMQKEFGPEFQQKMQKEFGPEFHMKMQKEFGPEFQKKMEKMGQEMQKRFGPGSDFEKQMKQLAEENAKSGRVYRLNGDGVYKLDKKQLEELKAEAARARSEGARARAEGAGARREGARARAEAGRVRQGEGWKVLRSGDSPYTFLRSKGDGNFHVFRSDSGSALDIKKFLKNLTPDQRDRQRKRGYIWWDDLTREQKEMLGGRPDGRFEIRYKINDDEITIRGN